MTQNTKILPYIKQLLEYIPKDWLTLTTHRLDIYQEERAKTQFLEQFELLFQENNTKKQALEKLPTAYDYIRLGHPLSSILEWYIAKNQGIDFNHVIGFSSSTAPILAVLRKNTLEGKNTRILYTNTLPKAFIPELVKNVYGYNFTLEKYDKNQPLAAFNGSSIWIEEKQDITNFSLQPSIDFYINTNSNLGSIILTDKEQNNEYIAAIQHVRRRETIAITPTNALLALEIALGKKPEYISEKTQKQYKENVLKNLVEITHSASTPIVGSSGLSVQYAIMMGLIDYAQENHPKKNIAFIVPPNCYGGTNDQARRVANCLKHVEVVDLPVDGDHNMVQSLDVVLEDIAKKDSIPYIIAEIPTNPRVEVPDLVALKNVLTKKRTTASNTTAIPAVFILDQTFCPNVDFISEKASLQQVKTIAYVSGSKFPSGGKCTAGYVVSNQKATDIMPKISEHLHLLDNQATPLQYHFLAEQLPSMLQRIKQAYTNTQSFVDYIKEILPEAKINFVSKALVAKGFTPSVFSLDLPTKGNTAQEKEAYKRALNLKLIHLMIDRIPKESKFCVSYGQLKGCYWTIPATSTQGTTKEADKDYIVRVSLSANMNLELHKEVFAAFVKSI